MPDDNQLSRRGFLGFITFLIGGLVSFIVGIPAISYIIYPATRKDEAQDLILLGSSEKVAAGEPALFKVRFEQKAGWIVDERELAYFVITDDKREYSALSNVCTHLSCRVRWVSDQELFFCPCHNATFDKAGEVVSGPPPRPLDRYKVIEEDGKLFLENN